MISCQPRGVWKDLGFSCSHFAEISIHHRDTSSSTESMIDLSPDPLSLCWCTNGWKGHQMFLLTHFNPASQDWPGAGGDLNLLLLQGLNAYLPGKLQEGVCGWGCKWINKVKNFRKGQNNVYHHHIVSKLFQDDLCKKHNFKKSDNTTSILVYLSYF